MADTYYSKDITSYGNPDKRCAFQHPKYAGSWKIGDIEVFTKVKPNWFHRKMISWILGWEWRDI